MDKEQNIVRQIFQSEITWIASIIFAGWGFIATVVLPLNTIQTQLLAIQQNQLDSKKNIQQIQLVDVDFNSRISVLEAEVKNNYGK